MTTTATSPTTRRERQRQATLAEIISVSRTLLGEPGGLSLRAVAQRMGITAPALYRYVADYHELVMLVAADIDARTAALLREARDSQPADDPAAQVVRAAVAFRHWALTHRGEFALVFTNPLAPEVRAERIKEEQVGRVFTDLLLALWRKYDFPLPAAEDLDPLVRETIDDPVLPADLDGLPESARTIVWVFTQSWMSLYGTVTLEVFGHCDPRISNSGALFRAMLLSQAELLGITEELPRLLPLVEEWLAE